MSESFDIEPCRDVVSSSWPAATRVSSSPRVTTSNAMAPRILRLALLIAAQGLALVACAQGDERLTGRDQPILDVLRRQISDPALAEGDYKALAVDVADAERSTGVDALLLIAMIERESRFDPDARGPRGAVGLMQLKPATSRETAERIGLDWKGEQTLTNQRSNIELGAAYLAHLEQRFKSWEAALVAYNSGPSRALRLRARGKPITSPYARAVLSRWNEFSVQER